jgi:uncharacterized membrane protein
VRAFAGFVIRLVAYALVLGIAARIAAALWVRFGLDGSIELQPFHDLGLEVLTIAPLVLAPFGAGALRGVAIFLCAFLAAAAVTAPFACAHFSGL